jgi:hypothetical protein
MKDEVDERLKTVRIRVNTPGFQPENGGFDSPTVYQRHRPATDFCGVAIT